VTSLTLDAEPACPGPTATPDGEAHVAVGLTPALQVERRSLAEIDRATWDAVAARNPWATVFSGWAFQRAWWDAYGANAHEETLVVAAPDAPAGALPLAIVPLMHRHEVEPEDAVTQTRMRHGADIELTPVPPTATAILMGASYHADYATILTAPAELPAVAEALAAYLGTTSDRRPWDVVDLRRLRCGDPTAESLAAAFGAREIAEGWTLNVEREDVCPVVTFPTGIDIEGFLGTLPKKTRHEIRRKVRRAEAVGEVGFDDSADPLADLETFITMHQKKWGANGLFPDTPGGAQSRVLFRRLFELHGPDGPLHLAFLSVGGRRIAAGIHFETSDGYLYYNAGVDPEALDISPGVLMIHAYVKRALATGVRRLDFLRGDEPYKYDWGAVDEPVQRVLVRQRNG
jgi:CelD/BcsL family acetyltransferase involved in cellulose biosynthesis